jgi:hypothetical protein
MALHVERVTMIGVGARGDVGVARRVVSAWVVSHVHEIIGKGEMKLTKLFKPV